jgi:hypothetical protein
MSDFRLHGYLNWSHTKQAYLRPSVRYIRVFFNVTFDSSGPFSRKIHDIAKIQLLKVRRFQRSNQKQKKQRRTDNTMTKRTNNHLQKTTQKTKDWATRTLLITGMNSCVLDALAVPAPHVTHVVLSLNDTTIIRYGNRVESWR